MHYAAPAPIRFGVYEVHPSTGELRRRGLRVRLPRQAAQILLLLLEEPGRLRTRTELRKRLWTEGTFVDFDHSINKCMHSLRAALGDPASNPRFIETVAGQGYRFVGIASSLGNSHPRPTSPSKKLPIAVLPFEVAPGDPELLFLRCQIASLVIDGLSRIAGLKVLGYSSVQKELSATRESQKLGSLLGARTLIVGNLTRWNDHLYVHAEMIETLDATQLWGLHLALPYTSGTAHPPHIAQQIIDRVLLSARPQPPARPPATPLVELLPSP